MKTEEKVPRKGTSTEGVLWCLLLVACAGASVQGVISSPSDEPRGETEEARSEREAVAAEEAAYQASLEKITDHVLREEVALAECADAGKDCKELREKFCEIDTLISSRGDHYVKRFCNATADQQR